MARMPVALPTRFAAARRARLVGRRYELEVLERVCERVFAGQSQVVLLGGEPGAGKTRLAAEVACTLLDHDATVLVGTATRDAGVPYQPFAEMLDRLLLVSRPGDLTRLTPELGLLSRHAGRHLPDGAMPAGEGRRDLFEAVAAVLRGVAENGPLAVILDDLHWAQLPTLALLDHVIHACLDAPVLVLGTFRTTEPDRSADLSARLADLHRLDNVRRLDLAGLDTDDITEFVRVHGGLSAAAARGPASVLRDRTGGNPFFLRETWLDLERRGGVAALRGPQRVPESVGETVAARLAGLGEPARELIGVAAVLGDQFDLSTLVRAGDTGHAESMDALDAATAVGLIEEGGTAGRYGFVHALTRQAVLDRLPQSRRTMLHARVAAALEEHHDPALVPRIAYHYLVAHVLGFAEPAQRYAVEAARSAAHSMAFEEAATWYEKAAALPAVDPETRAELSLEAATNQLRAGDAARARIIYDRLANAPDPLIRLRAAIGLEESTARPGLGSPRAADLLGSAIEACGFAEDDHRYARALGSLSRALAFAGRTDEARVAGARAIDLARRTGDRAVLAHALKTSLWHGLAPDMAPTQIDRSTELARICAASGDQETLSVASYFRSVVSYLTGRPRDLAEAVTDLRRSAEATGQPWTNYFADCVSQGRVFLEGDFDHAERLALRTLEWGAAFGVDTADGSFGVQAYMIRRETARLEPARRLLTGRESFADRWVPGLLALYTELGLADGIRRALRHLLDRDLAAHTSGAQWPIELAYMIDAAVAVGDREAAATLRPFAAAYAGKNLFGGQFIALFGSADRQLARLAEVLGDIDAAERHFAVALEMDRRMASVVHTADTLACHALMLHRAGRDSARARDLAAQATSLAEPIGQVRVLRRLEELRTAPEVLTAREAQVIRLLAQGLSNREIGARLHISGNTAANHIRSILMKTGAANRTQAARYATDNGLA
ncbi:AAA family ATPase [Actinoplanes sp. NPDC051633]|uniref:ATP-binding protein n=1 Tax=Actinoplanes sp. NPDC051633 TaxID=3155670 RepID=UPI00343B59F9